MEVWKTILFILTSLELVYGLMLSLVWSFVAKVLTKIQYGRRLDSTMNNGDAFSYSSALHDDRNTISIVMEVESDKYDCNNCDTSLFRDIKHSLSTFINDHSETLAKKLVMLKLQKYGYCFWLKQDVFKIEDYVTKLELPEEGLDEEQTQILFSKLSSSDLPYDHTATWEMLVCDKAVRKPRSDGLKSFYILLRVHHSVGDIVNICKILHRSILAVDFSKEKIVTTVKPDWTIKNSVKVVRDAFYEHCVSKFVKTRKNPLHYRNLDGDKHLVWISDAPDMLNKLKQIKKKKPNFNIADIVFTAGSIAFSKYFKKYYPEKKQPETVNVVYARKIHNENFKYSNCYNSTSVDNDIAINPDCIKIVAPGEDARAISYERVIEEVCGPVRREHIPERNDLCHRMFNIMDYPLVMIHKMAGQVKNCTALFSNLPGFPKAHFCGNRKLKDFVFFSPHYSPMGLCLSMFSYNDELKFGIHADIAVIETREQTKELLISFITEIGNLHKTLCLEYYA